MRSRRWFSLKSFARLFSIMTETQQITKNAITLKGSAELIAEYMNYGVNSILFQRGIYPFEDFIAEEHFGLTILTSKNEKVTSFLKSVLDQTQEWLIKKKVQKISMIIMSVNKNEMVERWDFNVDYANEENPSSNGNIQETGNKDLKIIQKEIREVLRQICATITFLPLLDDNCSFDIQIYTTPDCEVPQLWNETQPQFLRNFQHVQLKTFSTSLHKMETNVCYKADE